MRSMGWDACIEVQYKKCQNCGNCKDYVDRTKHFVHNCGIADNTFNWSMDYNTGTFTVNHPGCGLHYTGSY